ncbi:MAG: hypothetical protein GX971_01890 [Firmicutes bacterium]|nr:hypothetical protein [Bacillota bacterium]
MATVHLFVDTNFLIQCKKYDQINWKIGELEDVTEIVLLISQAVISEVDRQKHDGNSRRARKARAANSLFGQMLEDKELVSKVGCKQIILKFAPSYKLEELKKEVPELDVDRKDDELVAAAWLYGQQDQSLDVRVLTHDIGVALSAARCGIEYIMIPDAWLLPPENDDKDRKIAKLQEELRLLSQQLPMIELKECSVSGQEPVLLGELTENMLDQLEDYVKEFYPLEVESPNAEFLKSALFPGSLYKVIPPTAEEITRYEDRNEEWLQSFRDWVQQAFAIVRERKVLCPIEFVLTNEAGAPVENLVIEITTHGNVEMAPPSYTENENGLGLPEIPLPPSAPKGRVVSRLDSGFAGLGTIELPSYDFGSSDPIYAKLGKEPTKDRNGFYWKAGRPDQFSKKWVLECEEFRHKMEGEYFEILVRGDTDNIQGAISVVVSGANLRVPYKRTIPVNQPVINQEPYSVMLDIVRECLRRERD